MSATPAGVKPGPRRTRPRRPATRAGRPGPPRFETASEPPWAVMSVGQQAAAPSRPSGHRAPRAARRRTGPLRPLEVEMGRRRRPTRAARARRAPPRRPARRPARRGPGSAASGRTGRRPGVGGGAHSSRRPPRPSCDDQDGATLLEPGAEVACRSATAPSAGRSSGAGRRAAPARDSSGRAPPRPRRAPGRPASGQVEPDLQRVQPVPRVVEEAPRLWARSRLRRPVGRDPEEMARQVVDHHTIEHR